MKTISLKTIITFGAIALLIACNKNISVQQYYVNSKENPEFISVDIPSSILQLKTTDIPKEAQETLKSIKKVNFLVFKLKENNKDKYLQERETLKKIIKSSSYKDLIRFKQNENNIRVSYLGEENAIDEVLIFGYDNKKGFALVRLLGDKMNLSNIAKIVEDIKANENSKEIEKLIGVFK